MKNTKYVRATQAQIQIIRNQVLDVNPTINIADGQVVIEFLLNVVGFTMIPDKATYE